MADVVHTTRRTVLAIAGGASVIPLGAAAPRPASEAHPLLARLKALKAAAVDAWRDCRPDAEDIRYAYMVAARDFLHRPSRSVADLGVKAWIADVSADGGDIGNVALRATQVLAGDVRRLAGV